MTGNSAKRGSTAALAGALALLGAVVPGQAFAERSTEPLSVTAEAETPTLFDDEAGGNANADDPAIWRDPEHPERSLVIGTAKEGGLRVYDLDARLVQSIPAPEAPGEGDAPGRFNNVDIVPAAGQRHGTRDLAVVSDRGRDRLRVYRIAPGARGGPLVDVTAPGVEPIFAADQEEINEERTAYGLTTWTDERSGRSYALVSGSGRTEIALVELIPTAGGEVDYRKVRSLRLPSAFRLPDGSSWSPCGEPGELPQVEGMVVDPSNGTLYAGQETVGLWRVRADLRGEPKLIDRVRGFGVPAEYDPGTDECGVSGADPGFGGEHLTADVEGLALLSESDGDGYVVASSQGDDTFVLYDREREDHNEHEATFRVAPGPGPVDGSEGCDGVAVLNAPLGEKYEDGLLVVQDGHDSPGDGGREATNFKFVDLDELTEEVDD
ncbi:hydrolase [Actinopolyspora erythraea]|uniref:Hydrolase n=1 Tax=Actinopolyspora erythraea TaxID=414996 RepID=A0A099D8X1_9ACTN|nr:phytase [Actinopolyspora erythraea]ASU80355.1 hydrolase [Actinopolyspora erythraea]KGI82563.1 hydrolase [Actinopolyspora erythraea]